MTIKATTTDASFIKAVVQSLGHVIPAAWTDEDVVDFFNDLDPREIAIKTDREVFHDL